MCTGGDYGKSIGLGHPCHPAGVGWFVGGGLQYAMTQHWGIRFQYEYIDLGDVSFDRPGEPIGVFDLFSTHNRADLHEHNVSFALMYKF